MAKKSKVDPIKAKADKVRAAFSPANLQAVLKDHPPVESIIGAVKPCPVSKVEDLQRDLAEAIDAERSAAKRYADLRVKGIENLTDFQITQGTPAKVLSESLKVAGSAVQTYRDRMVSLTARLTELQGGLVAPALKALPASPAVVPKPTVENPKDVRWWPVARDVLEACVMVAPKDDARFYLNGVFLQADKQGSRTVATNGHCLLLNSCGVNADAKLPDWLEAGVIIPREPLSLALSTLGKLRDDDDEAPSVVMVGYAKGHAHATLRDINELVTFKVRVVDGKFPEYRKVVEDAGKVLEGGEREPMSAATLDGAYVKLAAAIGAKLGGKGVTTFSAPAPAPAVITFGGAPDSLFIIMQLHMDAAEQMPTRTLALIGNLSGTLAALKATQTRQKKQLAESKSEDQKKSLAAIIAERDQRIAAVVQAMNGKALEAPKATAPAPASVN